MKLQTVYVPVSVDERMPDTSTLGNVFYDVILSDGKIGKAIRYRDGSFVHHTSIQNDNRKITHWLEEQSNRIVLAEEELKELVESAWKKGMKSFVVHVGAKKLMDDKDTTNINKELNDFIQSKLKP